MFWLILQQLFSSTTLDFLWNVCIFNWFRSLGPKELSSVSIGEQYAMAVDIEGRLWYTSDVPFMVKNDSHFCRWWQVST